MLDGAQDLLLFTPRSMWQPGRFKLNTENNAKLMIKLGSVELQGRQLPNLAVLCSLRCTVSLIRMFQQSTLHCKPDTKQSEGSECLHCLPPLTIFLYSEQLAQEHCLHTSSDKYRTIQQPQMTINQRCIRQFTYMCQVLKCFLVLHFNVLSRISLIRTRHAFVCTKC